MKITKEYLTKLIRESIEEVKQEDVDDAIDMFKDSRKEVKDEVFDKSKFIKAIEDLGNEVYNDLNFRMNKKAEQLLAYIYDQSFMIPTKK